MIRVRLTALFTLVSIALAGCSSTRFPATRMEKKVYKEMEDAEYNPPTEKNYEGDVQIGGG